MLIDDGPAVGNLEPLFPVNRVMHRSGGRFIAFVHCVRRDNTLVQHLSEPPYIELVAKPSIGLTS